ncbi:MAG TPA: hypothetical protein VGE45_07290 [Chloroflexia bacterium]|jgi:DNA-binding CsgD family transcriptional regulator
MSVPDNDFSNMLVELRTVVATLQTELAATRTEVSTLASSIGGRLDREFQEIRAVHEELEKYFIQCIMQIQKLAERVDEGPHRVDDPTRDQPKNKQDLGITGKEAVKEVEEFLHLKTLTTEELKITYLSQDYDDTVIAEILALNPDIVKDALKNILRKLHVTEKPHAQILVIRSKLITPDIKADIDELLEKWWQRRENNDA